MKSPAKILKEAVTIKAEPKAVAKGFALGFFIGMLPIPGFQLVVSLGIATLLKFDKKAACLAVFNTNLLTGAFVFSFNYWLGKKILGVNPSFVIDNKIDFQFVSTIFNAGSDVFISLAVGGILTGICTTSLVYYALLKILLARKPGMK